VGEAEGELLLFRLGGRGYACRRSAVREVVDVGIGLPPIPGLASSSLSALEGPERPVALVSLRAALGMPDRGVEGRILVVATRLGPIGFLVDEVVSVARPGPDAYGIVPSRFSTGYVTGTVETRGASWLVIDWDALRLPNGAARR
jgi:chemotaxis signal transduction protein